MFTLPPSTPLEAEATRSDLRKIAMQVGQNPNEIEGHYDIIRLGELRFACLKFGDRTGSGSSAASSIGRSPLGKSSLGVSDLASEVATAQKSGDKPHESQRTARAGGITTTTFATNILRRKDRKVEMTDPVHAKYPWEAGLYLCEFIRENTELALGRRVINIEAGIGLPGFACSRVGAASVSLTDSNDDAVSLLHANRGLNPWLKNTEKMRVFLFDFTDVDRAKLIAREFGPYDLLVASDVLYSDRSVIATVHCLEHLVKASFSKDELLQSDRFQGRNIDTSTFESVDFSYSGLLTHEICFRQGEQQDGHLFDFLHLVRDKKWKWRIYRLAKSDTVFTIRSESMADEASHLIKTFPGKKARSTAGESSQSTSTHALHIHVDKENTPSLERPDTGTPIATTDVPDEGGKRGRMLESDLPESGSAAGGGGVAQGGQDGPSSAVGQSEVIDLTSGTPPAPLSLQKPSATVEKHIIAETLCVPLSRKGTRENVEASEWNMLEDEEEIVGTPTAATQTTSQGKNVVPKAFLDTAAACCDDSGHCFHRLDSLSEGEVILIKLYKTF